MTLISAISSLSIRRFRAVTPDEVENDPAIPDTTQLRPPEIACWRSHVNAWQHVVESGMETALILEDDVDWHINVKEQFALFSGALLLHGSPAPLRDESLGNAREQDQKEGDPDVAPYGTCDIVTLSLSRACLTVTPTRVVANALHRARLGTHHVWSTME